MATRTVSNAGGNWNATGTWVGGVVPVAGDDVNFTATSGNLTVNVSTANLIGITFANYVGTITFSNAINTSGFVNLGTGGYTQAGANGINLVGTTTLTSGGVTWSRTLTFSGTSITYTLSGNWTSTGTVTFSGTTATTVNGNTLNIGGNLTVASAATISGTTTFNFNGTGTWNASGGGVIRNNTTVNTAGTLTIGTNIYYDTGTLTYTAGTVTTTSSTLNIAANTTLATNGISWNNITTSGTITITLSNNLTLTGNLTVGGTLAFTLGGNSIVSSSASLVTQANSTFTVPQNLTFTNFNCTGPTILNGFQISFTGNFTCISGAGTLSGTTNLIMSGTGTLQTNLTVTNNLTFNTAGTITISALVYSTGTLTYTAGTIVTTGSTLTLTTPGGATLNTSGMTWNNVTISGGAFTTTLTSNLNVSGTLFLSGSTLTINGNTLNISGNLQTNASITTGTTAFLVNGTGTWSTGAVATIRNNMSINTAGTFTLSGTVYYDTGILAYTAGTVVTTGSTLNIAAATTLNTNGITWNNITTAFTGAITLSSNLTLTGALNVTGGTLSFTLGGNSLVSTNANLTIGSSGIFTMPANQTFKTLTVNTSAGGINTNTLTITENLVINAALSGSVLLIYGGTGTWTASGATALINCTMTINTAGTLTIPGTVYKSSGLFTYTAGTIDDTTGTVAVQSLTLNVAGFTFRKFLVNGTITLSSNVNATTFGTWGNSAITFTLGGNSLNFTHLELGNTGTTTLPTNWVCQNIEFTTSGSGVLNTNSITINGNILQSSSGFYSGTTTFTYAGTGSWNSTSTGYFSNNFTINTAGTLTFISANLGGGIFTYTAGTVVTTGSTLYIRTTSTIMNHGSIVWNNVILGNSAGSGGVTNITLNNKLTCLGTLTFGISNTTFFGTDGTFDTYGLVLGIDTSNRTTTLISAKTYRVRQSLTCTQATSANRVLLTSTTATPAIFTLDPGATIDLGFVNATDINSSLGRPIYSYKGVFSNTNNWGLLPTDNSRAGRSTFVG